MCVVRPSVLLLYESTLIPCRSWCRRVLLEPLIHLKRYRPGRALLHGVWDESTRKRRKVAIISTMLMDVQLFYIGLEVVIACLAVSGNVLVCWAVCLNSNLQSITNFFLVSLAVADIAVGLLAIPFAITISTGFCANFYGCLFIACFVLVLTQSSIFSLMAVAVDRYIAIKSPLRYSSLVTGQRAKGIIAVCWVLSVGIGLTPMLGWNKGVNNTTNSTCPEGMIKCLFEGVVTLDYMVYFNFFGCVLVPLLVMLAIYARIFMAARRQLRRMELKIFHVPAHREGASSSSGSSRSTLQKEVHAAKSLAIIVGLFALCWLPVHIINCVNLLCPNGRPHIWVMNIAIILSHANSVVNPLIYAYRIQEFRYTFRRIVYQHILCQKDGVGFGVDSGGDRAERTGSIMQTSSRLSVDTVVMNLNALDPSPHHSASHEASKHWTTGSELALISCMSNGHHIVDGILSPRLQQPCTTGFAAQDGGESTTYQGQTPGVLEVKDIGSSISFVNVRPLCPTHTSPTYSRELTEVS